MQWPKNLSDPAYDSLVLGAIASGNFDHKFVPLAIGTGVFYVSQDALKIGGVRINASAILQQHIADMIGGFLVTPKILDQMWAQRAVTILPCLQPIASTTEAMIKHSSCIDTQLTRLSVPLNGIVQTVGKTWVLSNKLTSAVAMNDGWHIEKQIPGVPFDPAPTLPGAHMIQSPGTRHGPQHSDYSQICLYVSKDCIVDGKVTTFAEVAQSLTLASLVSSEGPLRILRQPGAAPEIVSPPRVATKPAGAGTVALTAGGAAAGAVIGGPPGALVGAAVGWAADTIRRTLA